MRSQFCRVVAVNSASEPVPAFATTISGTPTLEKAVDIDSGLVTSQGRNSATSALAGTYRSRIHTLAPPEASVRTAANPIPFEPPVTTAYFPEKSNDIV